MKAFAGRRCSICKTAIVEGTDVHYSAGSKTIEHWECWDKLQPPSLGEIMKASELGWLPHAEAMLKDWSELEHKK